MPLTASDPAIDPVLGVIIVSFNSADVILDCLESLLAAPGVALHVVVVDNASTDGTPEALEAWAAGHIPYSAPDDLPFALPPAPKPLPVAAPGAAQPPAAPAITLIRAGVNGGFAAGVNLGLAELARHPGINRFWVLNPDSVVPPETPRAFAAHAVPGGFALMGGRVTYLDPPDQIQSDGGTINRLTGVTHNINLGHSSAATPEPGAGGLDFIPGSSMVASRQFYETAGPMAEAYFLYYEEVDWALRRGDLPLVLCPGARVYHRAGTAIGSPTLARIASPFSIYFLYRGRLRFMRRFFPRALPLVWAYALAKAGQIALRGYRAEARALFAACLGLPPPDAVRARLSPEAAARAFDAPARQPSGPGRLASPAPAPRVSQLPFRIRNARRHR